MSKNKWHINIHGIPALCEATVQECRRQNGSRDGVHYDTYQEAYIASQQEMTATYGATASITKPATRPLRSAESISKEEQRAAKAQRISDAARSAEGELAIKRQHFQHDDEMMVEQLNEKLPPHTRIAGSYAPSIDVTSFDQLYPHTIAYTNPDNGSVTQFHYTPNGVLARVTGEDRNSDAVRGVEKMLKGDKAIQHQMKQLSATRVNTDIAARREFDMKKTRLEVDQVARGENSLGLLGVRHVPSINRFQEVPVTEQNRFVRDMNAVSDTVTIKEVQSTYGGPSQFVMKTQDDKGIDVTNMLLNANHRYEGANTSEHAALHRDTTVLKMEQLHEKYAMLENTST